MYPLIRLVTCSLRAVRSQPLPIDEVCETTFRCRPWDLDMFLEMNNGRVLTLYDIGRFDLSIRSGLAKVLHRNKWGLVVAGSSVRYRKRIRVFDKVTMRTRVAAIDERWIYVVQSMWVKGEAASSVLLRTGITGKGKTIPTQQVLAAMDAADWQVQTSEWVQSWIDSEAIRPWPPKP